jgi:hypothetical protein
MFLHEFATANTGIDVRRPDLTINRQDWEKLLDTYHDTLRGAASQGSTKVQKRHLARGQLLGMHR